MGDDHGDTDGTPGTEDAPATARVLSLHTSPGATGQDAGAGADEAPDTLWHITLSVCGPAAPLAEVRRALERITHDFPALVNARYAADRAELRYWNEALHLPGATGAALDFWSAHRQGTVLREWGVSGLEVLGRKFYRQRMAGGPYSVMRGDRVALMEVPGS
ncbi:hypothetical protein ACFYVL_04290 [Streptomyces sp. NPDC004111]|uniref:hypothetical protein n=1 Tax=Streptomyces sp. NPDC004111 TaxID=3364690 RepID=UPI0036C5946E